jgi:hypothetical protein
MCTAGPMHVSWMARFSNSVPYNNDRADCLSLLECVRTNLSGRGWPRAPAGVGACKKRLYLRISILRNLRGWWGGWSYINALARARYVVYASWSGARTILVRLEWLRAPAGVGACQKCLHSRISILTTVEGVGVVGSYINPLARARYVAYASWSCPRTILVRLKWLRAPAGVGACTDTQTHTHTNTHTQNKIENTFELPEYIFLYLGRWRTPGNTLVTRNSMTARGRRATQHNTQTKK